MEIELAQKSVRLLPERAVYLPETKTMLVADLHLGKAEIFQMRGIAIPSSVHDDDLLRLSSALEKNPTGHLIVLGDLTHSKKGVTDDVTERVRKWRELYPSMRISLVRGNHDRGLVLPEVWKIEMHDANLREPPFLFTHEPEEEVSDLFTFAGHLHPTMTLRGRADTLRLPCFVVSDSFAVLPAFSAFTGGHDVHRRDWKRIFMVAENSVIEV